MVIETITTDEAFGELLARLRRGRGVVSAVGLWGSSAPIVAGLAARALARPLLYVTAHLDEADDARDDIELVCGTTPELLSAWETLPGEGPASGEIAAERIRLCCVLRDLHRGGDAPTSVGPSDGELQAEAQQAARGLMIVAPIQALLQPVPSLEALDADSIVLAQGDEQDPQALAAWLTDHGFERIEMVESPGDFAWRGGVLDIFPAGDTDPIRVEFFGERIESLRRFDPGTQRSTHDLVRVRVPAMGPGQPAAAGRTTSFLSYLPAETLIAFDEPTEIEQVARAFWERLDQPKGLFPVEAVFRRASEFGQLHLARFVGTVGSQTVRFHVESVQRFEARAADAVAELCTLARSHRVCVFCNTEAERRRLGELIVQTNGSMPESIELRLGLIHRGFTWAARLIVVGHQEIFHRYERRRRIRRVVAARPIESWLDLQVGDYVVHVVHGIAKFRGMKTFRKDGGAAPEEFLTLQFAEGATLHVPASQIDLVQKYVGAGPVRPPLSKLGGTRWRKTKEKVAQAVGDLAAELLRIQAAREAQPGIAYPDDTEWQREFEGSFVYPETEDQATAAEEIKADMRRARPMDRLLCGDVGYGKTELAMRAAFKAVEYGKQVAVLVPTTVLAEQHFHTFRERMADFPFVIECLSRFRTEAEQRSIVERTRKGQIDILIGTHRLLSKDVGFADLGLVIIDEEQRFGVAHKEHLKRLRETVDVLTLTATPIPRTLHMAMLGLRDISALATPPMDRRSIVTQVCTFDPRLIRDAIIREMNRDGQVYFVHNLVHDIQSVAEKIRRIVPEARVLVGHGQMHERDLEEVMVRFVRREADVLVCTAIIESGIDIPNVNTIFIDRADRFGLADLHQLRGRVGRYKHRAYCYLLLSPERTITPAAAKRLKAIEEFNELGAGFRIAMRDLEIRGAGNILGPEQSGHIAAVGYEMYCQLLEQAVRKLKNEPAEEFRRVHLDLGIAGHIPRRYIESDRSRMEIYRRLARCRSPEQLETLQKDLADAFGAYPPEVQTLLDLAEIRILAQPWGIRSIILQRPDVVFNVEDLTLADALFAGATGSVRMADPQTLHWRLPAHYLEPPTLVAMLRQLLRRSVPENILATR